MNKIFHKIIKEICDEEHILMEILSKDLVIKLTKKGITRFINGYKFDLNNHAIGLILDDKYATYDMLKSLNIPVAEHNILFATDNMYDYAEGCNNYDSAYNLFLKYNKNVVLKVNNGTCGKDVYHITEDNEFKKIYDNLLKTNFSISLCPYYNIDTEYRVIVLKNKIKLIYGKVRPIITGNGKDNLKKLLLDFNYEYFNNLTNNKVEWSYVPKKDEQYIYDWKFNLSNGSMMNNDISLKDKNILKTIALNVVNLINIGFASIDIIKTYDNKFYVLEVNSGVMIEHYINQIKNGYSKAKSIYKEAIKEMFKS